MAYWDTNPDHHTFVPIRGALTVDIDPRSCNEGAVLAVFSANATKVELCLFDLEGRKELERLELPEYTDEV